MQTNETAAGNKIIRQVYTADPTVIDYRGRVYYYTGYEAGPFADAKGSALITRETIPDQHSEKVNRRSASSQSAWLVLSIVWLWLSRKTSLCHEPQHRRSLGV